VHAIFLLDVQISLVRLGQLLRRDTEEPIVDILELRNLLTSCGAARGGSPDLHVQEIRRCEKMGHRSNDR
jgi:hypothetical protein